MIPLAVLMGTTGLSFAKQVLPSALLTEDSIPSNPQQGVTLYAAKSQNGDPCVKLSCGNDPR